MAESINLLCWRCMDGSRKKRTGLSLYDKLVQLPDKRNIKKKITLESVFNRGKNGFTMAIKKIFTINYHNDTGLLECFDSHIRSFWRGKKEKDSRCLRPGLEAVRSGCRAFRTPSGGPPVLGSIGDSVRGRRKPRDQRARLFHQSCQ